MLFLHCNSRPMWKCQQKYSLCFSVLETVYRSDFENLKIMSTMYCFRSILQKIQFCKRKNNWYSHIQHENKTWIYYNLNIIWEIIPWAILFFLGCRIKCYVFLKPLLSCYHRNCQIYKRTHCGPIIRSVEVVVCKKICISSIVWITVKKIVHCSNCSSIRKNLF